MANYGMSLAKGQEALMAVDGKPVNKIRLEVGWDPIREDDEDMDIDSSILVYQKEDPHNQELVSYFRLHSSNYSIVHNGDNVTGEDEDDDDYYEDDEDEPKALAKGKSNKEPELKVDETIDIKFDELYGHYNRLAVVINIYEAYDREQTFRDVENLFIRIRNMEDNSFICNFRVTDKIMDDNTVVIGLFLKKGTQWIFKALGASYSFNRIEDFADMVARH